MAKAHVEVFGHDVDDEGYYDDHHWHHHYHRGHGAPVFGVMVLLAGIMLFLNVIGRVPWGVWHVIWQFWPVLLIFVGLQILSELILFLLALFVLGSIAIYSMQAVGVPFVDHWVLPDWITVLLMYIRRVMP